jgi:hypothetical protein
MHTQDDDETDDFLGWILLGCIDRAMGDIISAAWDFGNDPAEQSMVSLLPRFHFFGGSLSA